MNHKVLVSVYFVALCGIFVSSQIDGIPCNDANQGRHFPSGINCSLYFTCFNGDFHLQNCPPYFWFNFERQACDPAGSIGCDIGPEGVECTSLNQGRHYPTAHNCSSYYTCFDGSFHLQNCPLPFLFNYQRQACDLPENVDCDLDGTTPTPPTIQTTTTSLTTTTVPIPTECPSSGVAKIPNPISCSTYFLCFSGTAVEQSCSPGLFFSRSQLRCVRREESDCEWSTNVCPPENDPDNIVFLPNQEDCRKYFICYNGAPQELDCGPSLHWDPSQNWCVKEEESTCEPVYILPDIRETECPESSLSQLEFVPHPENCQFYFMCFASQSHLMRCSNSLLFDHVLGDCYFRDRAICYSEM